MGNIIIAVSGMYDYFSRRYIKHKHEQLNGKTNAWRIEPLKIIDKVWKKLKTLEEYAINYQEYYARERIAMIQKNVYEFEECCISLLNIDAINKVVLREAGYRDNTNLVYFMSKIDAFEQACFWSCNQIQQ